MSKRQLICACCGRYAGSYKQWWNQDTGYGLCSDCADYIMTKIREPMSVEELERCYGKAGVNRQAGICETSQLEARSPGPDHLPATN